jgi:hypothetical protein
VIAVILNLYTTRGTLTWQRDRLFESAGLVL